MTRLAATLLTLTLFAGPAAAQQVPDLRQAAKSVRFETAGAANSGRAEAAAARRKARMSGVQRGILTGLAGFGGFFAGAYIGAAIEGPCNCDDPGLKGALIGMPIGAASAAIATWILTGRD